MFKTEDHPSIATTLYGIGQELSNLGRNQEALDKYERVLGKFIKEKARLLILLQIKINSALSILTIKNSLKYYILF